MNMSELQSIGKRRRIRLRSQSPVPEECIDLTVDSPAPNIPTSHNASNKTRDSGLNNTIVIDDTNTPLRHRTTRRQTANKTPKRSLNEEKKAKSLHQADDRVAQINETQCQSPTVLMCPICYEDLKSSLKPTSTKCGHIFCESCIHAAVTKRKKCPARQSYLSKQAANMSYNVMDIVVPALGNLAVKLIDRLVSDDNKNGQNQVQQLNCCCGKRVNHTLYDNASSVNMCNACGRNVSSTINNQQYLTVATEKTRSKSIGSSIGDNKSHQKYTSRTRCMSDGNSQYFPSGNGSRHTILSSTRFDDENTKPNTMIYSKRSKCCSTNKSTSTNMINNHTKLVSCQKTCRRN